MPLTKNIFIRLLDDRLNKNNIKFIKNIIASSQKDNILNKLMSYIFLPIFVSILAGLVVFYVQRQDLITSKKMESFEYIITQFNILSSN
ncbi:MAG: hypothetical protein HRT42_08435, partial [Campylobacteraceae bacterium]|nr:hypothetical protein [Campylobacteraceae bacterium]